MSLSFNTTHLSHDAFCKVWTDTYTIAPYAAHASLSAYALNVVNDRFKDHFGYNMGFYVLDVVSSYALNLVNDNLVIAYALNLVDDKTKDHFGDNYRTDFGHLLLNLNKRAPRHYRTICRTLDFTCGNIYRTALTVITSIAHSVIYEKRAFDFCPEHCPPSVIFYSDPFQIRKVIQQYYSGEVRKAAERFIDTKLKTGKSEYDFLMDVLPMQQGKKAVNLDLLYFLEGYEKKSLPKTSFELFEVLLNLYQKRLAKEKVEPMIHDFLAWLQQNGQVHQERDVQELLNLILIYLSHQNFQFAQEYSKDHHIMPLLALQSFHPEQLHTLFELQFFQNPSPEVLKEKYLQETLAPLNEFKKTPLFTNFLSFLGEKDPTGLNMLPILNSDKSTEETESLFLKNLQNVFNLYSLSDEADFIFNWLHYTKSLATKLY